MRSSFALLFASLGAIAAVTNCTVKSVEDDGTGGSGSSTKCTPGVSKGCTCTNGKSGGQVCNSKGTGYAACICDGVADSGGASNAGEGGAGADVTGGTGGSVSTAGTSAVGGASEGGASGGSTAGAGGAGEEDAAVVAAGDACDACVSDRCSTEYEACAAAEEDCMGSYSNFLICVSEARKNGLVKRDVVRGCGVDNTATSSMPSDSEWPPATEIMPATTAALINCLAGGNSEDSGWANDVDNFDPSIKPWTTGTCAKDACTAAITAQP